MPFWVHGRDAATGQARDSLFIETESEGDARQQAAEAGMAVEEVEHVHAAPPAEAPTTAPAAREDAPKATPVRPPRCARCNSERVVPRATIWDWDSQGGSGTLQAYVYAKPDALLFRGTVYAHLYARICADCGYAELFADGAEELYDAYKQSQTGAQ